MLLSDFFDLDITLELGNFYSHSNSDGWFWKFLPALISAGVTYFIFQLGQSSTKKREKEKEEKRIKDVREYFYITLLKFKVGVDIQVKIFNEIIEKLKNDKKDSISTLRSVSFSFDSIPEQLLEISKNDTFKFFIQDKDHDKHKRIKVYSNFYGVLKLIEEFRNQIEENNKNSVKKYEKSQKNIEINRDKLIEMIKKKIFLSFQEGNGGIISDPYYVLIGKAYDNYNKKMNGTKEPIMNEFIFPIQSLSLSDLYKTHKDSLEALNICKEAESNYKLIFENKILDQENFEHWNSYYSNMSKIVKAIIELEFKDFTYGEEIFALDEKKAF